jgi:putative Holliday junction resolvase
MGRILALDYGTKRVGVAVTDEFQIIASPLDTIHSSQIIQFLTDYMAKNEVDVIVIGEPKRLNNEDTDSSKLINEFVVHLTRKFPLLKIDRMDERFTSKIAKQTILASGVNKKRRQDKALVDTISATLILQSYMAFKK